jgi:putative phosphoesterase
MAAKLAPTDVRLAIVSDTHLPKGNHRLPEACVKRLRASDLIVHAGDLIATPVLEQLRSYSKVIAVHGNVDDLELRRALPETAEFQASGQTIALIHDAGPSEGRLGRLRRMFPTADAVVFGHSHLPLHETAEDGFQIFNPGSPTERRRAPHRTMGVAEAKPGNLSFELIRLD